MFPTIPPLEPLESHAADVLAGATGRTLVMWTPGLDRALPEAVTSVHHFGAGVQLQGVYNSVVSIGRLGTTVDLEALLLGLRDHLGPQSVLYFCEPTLGSDGHRSHAPHDVTGTLWACGFSVIQCRRFRARYRLRTYHYCWGRARLERSRVWE